MTRWLSEILEVPEPYFRQGLRRLEAANHHQADDIRLSTEVMHASQAKLRELGLDPHDTTARELYRALEERLSDDDARLAKSLRTRAATHVSAEADVVDGMVHAIRELPESRRCFALKAAPFKLIIKQLPPKKAMKRLGYRSLDSFLKHEAPAAILAAAWLSEGTAWQQKLLDRYKKLSAADFENRSIALVQPTGKRWNDLSAEVVARDRHNLLCCKELGALVLLPLPADTPPGAVTASLSLALHELNEIRASSTFLKLYQVRPDFGAAVRTVASEEPKLASQLLDRSVPWHLIQRYYSKLAHHGDEQVFEPHLQLEDMIWQPIEHTLAAIEPHLAFWQGSGHLGVLHQGQRVSLNIIDAALNCCNRLPFERRLTQNFERSLWHELLLRYLRHDTVEQTILNELQPQLAVETVTA